MVSVFLISCGTRPETIFKQLILISQNSGASGYNANCFSLIVLALCIQREISNSNQVFHTACVRHRFLFPQFHFIFSICRFLACLFAQFCSGSICGYRLASTGGCYVESLVIRFDEVINCDCHTTYRLRLWLMEGTSIAQIWIVTLMSLIILMRLVVLLLVHELSTCFAKQFKFVVFNKRAPLLPFVCQIVSIHYFGNDDECCRKQTNDENIQINTRFETAILVLTKSI